MTPLDDVDLAKVDPCPSCGVPVRRFASVPIAGTNRDPITSGPWPCTLCEAAYTFAVCRGLEATSTLYALRVNLLGVLAA